MNTDEIRNKIKEACRNLVAACDVVCPSPPTFVVVHGTPATGFTIHGPFHDVWDAGDWADQHLAREYDYWVMPVMTPAPADE